MKEQINTQQEITKVEEVKREENTSRPWTKKKRRPGAGRKGKYRTHNGEPISKLQNDFIDNYIELGVVNQAALKAGYKNGSRGYELMNSPIIQNEIDYRMSLISTEKVAKAEEILSYFTKVMRGEELDQFGLDAPLSERTKAAVELAKRTVDITNKINGNDPETVTLVIERR